MASKLSNVPERRDDLIVQKVGDEVIVYDRVSHRAHSLNRTAALVFEKLDGKNDLAGVARHLGKSLGRSSQKELVASAVNELAAADLLRPGAALPRRTVLRGMTAALVPVVMSIAVPTAAAAMSCIENGSPCLYGVDTCCTPSDGCVDCGGSFFTCLTFCP